MRLALLSFALLGTAWAQDSESNMSCVERLEMPQYPPLPRQARISGSVTATASLGSTGVVETKTVGHPLLADAVTKAVAGSAFLKSCAGKSVIVIYDFEIDTTEQSNAPTKLSFSYPNQFRITVPAPLPNF